MKYREELRKPKASHSKSICLYCLKSNKGGAECCGFRMYPLGSKPRTPKLTAKTSEWKKFIELFIHINHTSSVGQMNRIIQLKKQYKISTTEDEMYMKDKMKENTEITTVFDIPRHLFKTLNIGYDYSLFKDAENMVENIFDDVKRGETYYVMPGAIYKWNSLSVPSEWRFDVYKATGSFIQGQSDSVTALKVFTESGKETISLSTPSSKINYRQPVYIFTDRISALAFRQKYLSNLLVSFEKMGLNYIDKIKDVINLDFDRVCKKAPAMLL